jgi:hypothetical protein
MTATDGDDLATSRPGARSGLVVLELDDELVVYDAAERTLHHLNATASLVWKLCDGTHAVAVIIATIAEMAAVDVELVRADVVDLIAGLHDAALLVDEERSPRPMSA